ncbi:MAG: cytochrome P450 [Actinomycetota bacterium]|nr:cytochrome P450 [Actinomycetota bacterium]
MNTPPTAAVDLSSIDFWALTPADREERFARLRAEAPVTWQRQPESQLLPESEGTGGYWAVVRYDDVREVSRDAARFRSGQGVMFEDIPAEMLEASQSFLAMDDPRHAKLRKLVAEGFKPRAIRRIEDGIRADARTIVDELDAEGDFVEAVAKRLPMMTIMRMLGVPEPDQEAVMWGVDAAVSWNDPEFLAGRTPLEVVAESMRIMTELSFRLCAERRECPADDLVTDLVQAEVDGERLTDAEIGAFMVLLSVAGNDTTRHTTSHAMRALCDFPDQRALLLDDLDGRIETAVEEFVRWATPVMTFRRTATRDTEIAGQPIAAGDKVVMFYSSANRDETAFDDPNELDLARDPNRHVGFGGGGPHFCMGASLARTQLAAIFAELLRRHPRLEVGEPSYVVGNFVNGIARMPFTTS